MNQERFDELTRILATSKISRGKVIRLLGVAVLSGALGGFGLIMGDEDAEAKKKGKGKGKGGNRPPPQPPPCVGTRCGTDCCTALENCCGGSCVSEDDPKNCGQCGNDCTNYASGATCTDLGGTLGFVCTCPGRAVPCGTAPNRKCVDLQGNDTQNCGQCGNDCGANYAQGAICSDGQCACSGGKTACPQPGLPGGTSLSCVDTETDANNCGGCAGSAGSGGKVCPTGGTCVSGKCQCGVDQDCCGDTCCKINEVCFFGSCEPTNCPEGYWYCGTPDHNPSCSNVPCPPNTSHIC